MLDRFDKYRPLPKYPTYPPYHTGFYLENYFYNYFISNNIKTNRIYIPINWTTCYIENKTDGLQEILDSLDQSLSYFTVSQHDDAIKEKLPKNTKSFCAGGNSGGIPIPLVCSNIPLTDIPTKTDRDLLCSFYGSITHPIRQKLVNQFKNKPNTIIHGHSWSININKNDYFNYVNTAVRSKFLLCPRGYGLQSFRQYESFQLGCVPVIITDNRFLPWEDELDWESFSIITNNINNLYEILQNISDKKYNDMLMIGQKLYNNYFTLEATCKNIIKRL